MNLGNFIFHQGNGVSSNGDPWNPVTSERLYMQGQYPMLVQRQGYHSNNRPESFDSVFSPEVPVMQTSNLMPAQMRMNQIPSDGRLIPEQPVVQRPNSVLAEMQRQRQSVNCLEPCNDRGVLQEQPAMQSFIPTPGIMQGNQVGNGRQRALELFKLFSGNQIMQTPDPIPTQTQGNQTQGADWVESIEFYSGILKDASTNNNDQNVAVAGPLGNYQSSIQSSAEIQVNGCFPQSANCHVDIYGKDVAFRDLQPQVEFYSGILKDASTSNNDQNVAVAGPLGNYQSSIQSRAEIQVNGCFPQSANCHVDIYGKDVAFRDLQPQVDLMSFNNAPPTPGNGAPNRGVSSAMMLSPNSSYSQIENAWAQQQYSTPVLQQQERALVINQTINSYSLENIRNDGYPLPYQPFNNPPSTPQVQYAAPSSTQSMYNLATPPSIEYPAASSTTTWINIAPVTPEKQSLFSINQLSATNKSSVIESCSPGKDEQGMLPTCTQGVGSYSSQLLPGGVPSPANSISLKEKVPEDRASGGIDLNRTPQQKTQKRKKHRPKVVVEGKPKRSPKVAASKAENSSTNPTAKRKYVRRKGLNTPTSLDNEKSELEASTSISASRSCRRELNFSSEEKEEKFQVISETAQLEQYPHHSTLNLNSQETTASMGSKSVSLIQAAEDRKENRNDAGRLQITESWNFITATNQKPATEAPRDGPKAHLATAMNPVNMRNNKTQNGSLYQVNEPYKNSQEDENVYVGADQVLLQEKQAWASYNREMQLLSQSRSNHIRDSQEMMEKTGQKRDYIDMSKLACSQYSSNHNKTDKICETGTLGTYKRTKLDEIHGIPCSVPFSTAAAENIAQQIHYSSIAKSSTATEVSTNRNHCQNLVMENQFCGPMAVGNQCQEKRSSEEIFHRDRMRKTLHQKTETHVPDLLTRASNQNMDFPSQRVPPTINSHTDTAVRSQTGRVELSNQKIRSKKEQKNKETANLYSSRKARGKKEEKVTIDEIIRRLEVLDIRNSDQALVPYEGHGTLVPFEGFEPLRRRKPRPKVNLDSQTIRQWNLLMGNVTDEDTTDPDKEKWWEAEREVFNGRVEKFIARMHLVQGDRRFSPWKGSVVDSVIGVFLTQNVSDHLSSSAFMSLAAQFPLSLAVTKSTCCTPTSTLIEEPELQIIDPDGTITFPWGAIRQPLYKQDSTTSSNYSEQLTENLITQIGVHLTEDNNVTTEDVVSSQNSSDSIILQASEDVRNSSDSEVEGQTIFPKPNQLQNKKLEIADRFPQNSFLLRSLMPAYQPLDNSACLGQNPRLSITKHVGPSPINLNVLSSEKSFSPSTTLTLNFISNTGGTEPCLSVPSVKPSIPSFQPSEANLIDSQDVLSVRKSAGSIQANLLSSTTEETGTTNNHRFRIEGLSNANHDVNLLPESPFVSCQPSTNNHQKQSLENFPCENSTATETQRPDEAQSKRQSGKLVPSGENLGSTGSNMSNGRRKKNDTNKIADIDWDALRKQVLQEGRNKERGVDKMDSMDYEALRHADVGKISYAIRERGMNNMLAERIKAFLNRVVSDHGSIDLEWLRDVPSDKAKDYLLSIRGLGLKSVECVRLLSLHHMAFPVDTNVGRIAVRLGWVPIQPLPESLQLHLLEMYPILETVQKYLWPRLCKLDQRTLYELHYQMITFGKVFCTKSKPNCNVCPMKGDCRHFASAFASARLALPGLEERSMVSSSTPVAPVKELNISMGPLLLPSAESSLGIEPQHFSGKWEPIVEEPRTPESSTEVTESDIEDMLSEDPDEIPMIKFSLEALKANVQNVIQEQNMQISEGDLSRALVALDPATASIPAPKLKNVSRLRTEHQVYELPDSHPVLEGLDRREPDDPSPYLLAIWTPGETENSVQPSESKCNLSESGKLCDEKRCFQCNSIRERDSGIVRGTILIPCRTAMRGSFPLNGTYFQVNEVFADHESGMSPIAVPRDSLWHLPRRTVYFGTSVTTIFKGMTIEGIQYCFWRGFVCVRGFDRKTRAPKPLLVRLHFPASKLARNKKEGK